MVLNIIDKEIKNYMWNFIDEVCVEIGPRPSASVAEKKAGDRIEKELRALCDETYQEEFTLAPKAFLGFVRYSAIMILCSVLFYWLSILVDSGALLLVSNSSFIFLIIGLILVSVSFFYFVFEVMLQQEVIDFLYSKKKANNVIGIINSKAEKEQELIFGAHIDSAYEYKPFYYLKTFGGASILIGLISVICIFVFFWFKLIFYFIQIEITPLFIAFGIIMLISIPFGFIFIFFLGKNAVQGAYDNLSGVAILLGIAGRQCEMVGHGLEAVGDQLARDAHSLGLAVHLRPGLFERFQSLFVIHHDAGRLQYLERLLVDLFDLGI